MVGLQVSNQGPLQPLPWPPLLHIPYTLNPTTDQYYPLPHPTLFNCKPPYPIISLMSKLNQNNNNKNKEKMNPPNLIASKLPRRGTPTRSSTTIRKLPCPLCNHSLSKTSCSLPTVVMFRTGRSFYFYFLPNWHWISRNIVPTNWREKSFEMLSLISKARPMSLHWPRSWDTIMCSCVGVLVSNVPT